MKRDEIRSLILAWIGERCPGEDLSDLDPEIPLRDQVDLDSVDFLNMIMEIQERLGIEIPEDDFVELMTLDGCVEYLAPRLQAAGRV